MKSRTLVLATCVALHGCVPETRVEPQDVSDGGSDSGPLDVPSNDQPSADVGRGADARDAFVDVQFDASNLDIPLFDAIADAGAAVDAVDTSIDTSDRPSATDVPSESDVIGDAVAADAGCPPCTAANAVATCVAGACRIERCNSGFGDCNANVGDGCETALSSMGNCVS